MEYKYFYKNLIERQTQIAKAESKSYRMLHDTFDANWKRRDEPHGVMIFTDIIPEPPLPEPVRDLAKEFDDLKAELKTKGIIK